MNADQSAEYALGSPMQRWGTCCPFDPQCEHSFLDDADLSIWLYKPITDDEAKSVAQEDWSPEWTI